MIKIIIIVIVTLLVERQFFDESIRCLGLGDNCQETESPIKDDEIDPPNTAPCDVFIEDPLPEYLGEVNPVT